MHKLPGTAATYALNTTNDEMPLVMLQFAGQNQEPGVRPQEVLRATLDHLMRSHTYAKPADLEALRFALRSAMFGFEVLEAVRTNRELHFPDQKPIEEWQPCSKCGFLCCEHIPTTAGRDETQGTSEAVSTATGLMPSKEGEDGRG